MEAIGGSRTLTDDAQTTDTQATDTQATDTQATETQATDAQAADTLATDAHPQVFVDLTGHRRRLLQTAGYAAAFVCLVFAVILVTSLVYGPISPQAIH